MDELATRRRGRHATDPIIAAALASGATHADAARAAGVAVRTVSRRVADPSFCAQIDELRARSLEGIADRLLASTTTAIETLLELQGPDQPPNVRANAARALLSTGLQYRRATSIAPARPAAGEDTESVTDDGKRPDIDAMLVQVFRDQQAAGEAPPDPP